MAHTGNRLGHDKFDKIVGGDVKILDQAIPGASEQIARHEAQSLEVPVTPQRNKEDDIQRLAALGIKLQGAIHKRVGEKNRIERRMIANLRQYRGVYDSQTLERLKRNDFGSRIFVKLTRARTDAAEARLSNMLLPNDEDNFELTHSPVPRLAQMLKSDQLLRNPSTGEVQKTADGQAVPEKEFADFTIKAAKKAAKGMQKEISDQLLESRYSVIGRQVIHNACLYGTGVLKGPAVVTRTKRAWVQRMVEGSIKFELKIQQDLRPNVKNVSPWHFFPDLSTPFIEDGESIFERHLMTPKQLRKLKKLPGFIHSQIDDLLETDPAEFGDGEDTHISELQELSDTNAILDSNRYRVWEYHGPIDKEALLAAGVKSIDEDDPAQLFEGVIWFSNNVVIKAGINILDSEEYVYSVFNWEQDETTPFGFGIPEQMKDPQQVANAAWRMILDNAALGTGPQMIIDKSAVKPADGKWVLAPRKIWLKKHIEGDTRKIKDFMTTFNIDTHLNELLAIFNQARALADEETSVPKIVQGVQSDVRQTFSGLSMTMNASNIVLRRAVKNYDDHVTKPLVTRFYDYNMQFSRNMEIKGDFEVKPRGSTVLLTREIQAQTLLSIIPLASNPIFGPWVKVRPLFEELLRANQVVPSDIIKTQEEFDEDEQKAQDVAANAPPPQPDANQIAKIESDQKLAGVKAEVEARKIESALNIAELNQETALLKLAAQKDISAEKLDKELAMLREKAAFDREKFVAEIQLKLDGGTGI